MENVLNGKRTYFAILRKLQPLSWNYGQVELILGSLREMGVLSQHSQLVCLLLVGIVNRPCYVLLYHLIYHLVSLALKSPNGGVVN